MFRSNRNKVNKIYSANPANTVSRNMMFQRKSNKGAEESNLSKHLPSELYEYLAKQNMLDQSPHIYKLGETEGTVCVKDDSELVSIEFSEGNRYPDTTGFSDKVWCLSGNGYGVGGNKKYAPISGLSQEECEKVTPETVKNIIDLLDKILIPANTASSQLRY